MKIISLSLNPHSSIMSIDGRKLQGVIVKYKDWLGKEKIMYVYPTSTGPAGSSNRILYFYFCDEQGKELGADISKTLNNFCHTQALLGKLS